MYKLIEFLRRTYVVALFIVLEAVAIGYYARSSDYTQARLLTASNSVVGGLQATIADIKGYFRLHRENRLLLDRLARLEGQVAHYRQLQLRAGVDTLSLDSLHAPYRVTTARVISNSINKAHNFITLDRGARDGVAEGMGVLSPEGAMVGYVVAVSDRYAVVLSALNTSLKASGKLGGTDFFGSIVWEGSDRYHVRMKELSKYADIVRGDTVFTTGFSQYFPPDVPIGYVEEHVLSDDQMAYEVDIRLAVDMSRLTGVILVDNRERDEVRLLEDEVADPNRRD